MSTALRRLALPILAGVTVIGLPGPALASTPIGPNQSFVGLVNGRHTDAVVQVVCAGPIWPGRTGAGVGGQKVSVSPSPALAGPGFTGRAGRRVVVRFGDDPSKLAVVTSYDTPTPLPSGIQLPCFGTGVVRFTPRPTSPTAHDDTVRVTYENIAL
jgi:hypothetical protein